MTRAAKAALVLLVPLCLLVEMVESQLALKIVGVGSPRTAVAVNLLKRLDASDRHGAFGREHLDFLAHSTVGKLFDVVGKPVTEAARIVEIHAHHPDRRAIVLGIVDENGIQLVEDANHRDRKRGVGVVHQEHGLEAEFHELRVPDQLAFFVSASVGEVDGGKVAITTAEDGGGGHRRIVDSFKSFGKG